MKVNMFIMKVDNQENNTQTVDQALKNIYTISFKRNKNTISKQFELIENWFYSCQSRFRKERKKLLSKQKSERNLTRLISYCVCTNNQRMALRLCQ